MGPIDDYKFLYKIDFNDSTSYIGKLSKKENPLKNHATRKYVNEEYGGWEGKILKDKNFLIDGYSTIMLDEVLSQINNYIKNCGIREPNIFWEWCVLNFKIYGAGEGLFIKRNQLLSLCEWILILNQKNNIANLNLDYIGKIKNNPFIHNYHITFDYIEKRRKIMEKKLLNFIRTFNLSEDENEKGKRKVKISILNCLILKEKQKEEIKNLLQEKGFIDERIDFESLKQIINFKKKVKSFLEIDDDKMKQLKNQKTIYEEEENIYKKMIENIEKIIDKRKKWKYSDYIPIIQENYNEAKKELETFYKKKKNEDNIYLNIFNHLVDNVNIQWTTIKKSSNKWMNKYFKAVYYIYNKNSSLKWTKIWKRSKNNGNFIQ